MATGGDQDLVRYVKDDAAVGGKMPVMCDPCGRRKMTTPAAVLCSSCDVNVCQECRQGHQIYALGEHVFVSLDEEASETVLVDMQGLDRCSDHNRPFLFICNDHESLCCEYCLFDIHRTCEDMYKLTDRTTGADSSVIVSEKEMQVAVSAAQEIIDKCEEKVQENEERKDEIISELDQKKEDIIKRFDDAKRRIVNDLDEVIASYKTRLDDVKREAESVKVNLQSLMSLNSVVNEHGTDVEKSILNFTCKQKTARSTVKLTELQSNDYTVQHTLEWSDHLLPLMDDHLVSLRHSPPPSATDTTVNHAQVNVPETDTIVKAVQDPQPLVTDQPSAPVAARPAKLTLVTTRDLVKKERDVEFPWVCGLDFLPDGRIAAVDGNNKTCFIMDAGLQRLGSAFEFQNAPFDVTCCKEDKLAVTVGHSIALMMVSKKSSITLQKTLTTSFGCSTIALLDADTFIVGTINHQHPVRTVSVQGQEGDIRHKLLPDKKYRIYQSSCTYIPCTKTVVFSYRGQNTVYMCDLTSGEGRVIKTDKIRTPKSACAGPAGTVFVCSGDTQSIVQLSPQGDVLMTNNVGMMSPYAICLSRDDTRMAVSNSAGGQKMIKLFMVSS